ncbi:glycosyltransferase family 4 protein [Paraburkholderia rhizosphaerae]|uniref:Glycosyltransferase involved in cell wall biosynthesis n=1 Tax=Paraburkholderia rhizosphaerae TaxID=480658 RepID=A0A4R8LIT7_9BURK|nr:glycosyltransferase family 4 protein [Paraburkholderia rhizosphaerae]TDY43344.1 glycosyltransferase involved in cell wall biosynthesis [Paraburkholderia rhizosphaerae]
MAREVRPVSIDDTRHSNAPGTGTSSGQGRERMVIALVVEAANGGAAVHVADLIRGLHSDQTVDLHLVASIGERFDSSILNEAVTSLCTSVHRIPMHRTVSASDLKAFPHLLHCLHRIKPDIVHSHSSKAGTLARVCFGQWRHVYTPHSVYTLNPSLSRGERTLYGMVEGLLGRFRSDRVIAVSEDEANHLRESLGVPTHIVETILNGITKPDLVSKSEAREALALSKDALVVGFVGRLEFQKGVDRLVRIASAVKDRGLAHVVFAVVGPGDFASAANMPRDAIPPNLRLVGPIPDARRYFSAFDIFALPSRYEAFPYVILEAMAANVPIISTRVPGAANLIEAEDVGIVVPNHDETQGFADAIVSLVKDDTGRRRMRTNCERVAERFRADRMVKNTIDLYRRVLTK